MQRVYAMDETDKRKLRFLYYQSAIDTRYSVLPDYSLNAGDWQFYPATENLEPFPDPSFRCRLEHDADHHRWTSAAERISNY